MTKKVTRENGLIKIVDPDNSYNKIVFSKFKEFQAQAQTHGFSVKYVATGQEFYTSDAREFTVKEGQFLLVNHTQKVEVVMQSNKIVEGLCLFVDPSYLKEIAFLENNGLIKKLDQFFTAQEEKFGTDDSIFPSQASPLQHFLTQTMKKRNCLSWDNVEPDFYYTLAESIWRHLHQTHQQIERISAERKSTREELHRRLLLGVGYIHDNYNRKVQLKDMAQQAMLSEFHFLRTFRQCFGLSPYQYLKKLRLEEARRLVIKGKLSITEISDACGFSDVRYFRKAFKSYFGESPTTQLLPADYPKD